MQTDFKTATQRLRSEDFIISAEPPFSEMVYPRFLPKFFQDLTQQQAQRDVVIEGIFCHGGAHADLAVGRQPKDFDVFISSPQWVERFKTYWKELGWAGQSEYRELSEAREFLIEGRAFPLSGTEQNSKVYQADLLGEYFGFSGFIDDGEQIRAVDLVIASKQVTPAEFLSYQPAPIMAAAVEFDAESGKATYTHHKKFRSHVEEAVLCTNTPNSPNLLEKAERKGWTIITPDQEAKSLPPENQANHTIFVGAPFDSKLG